MAEQPVVFDGAVKRIALPAFTHWLGVKVAGKQQVRTGTPAVDLP